MKQEVGGNMDDAVETLSGAGEGRGETETPETWRNTTTQERDTILGHKLQEVNMLCCRESKFWTMAWMHSCRHWTVRIVASVEFFHS